jgi:hypothetical protein
MRTLLLSALALGALTSAAMAEPVKLTDAQIDEVTAGADSCGDGNCDVGGGAASVQHHHGVPDAVVDICTPGLCRERGKLGEGDTHVDVTPQNNN